MEKKIGLDFSTDELQDVLIALCDSIERERRLMETAAFHSFREQSRDAVERLEVLRGRVRGVLRSN